MFDLIHTTSIDIIICNSSKSDCGSKLNKKKIIMTGSNGNGNGNGSAVVGTSTVKQGLAQMLKGGVIVS
jgi:hypothetical protein